VPKRNARLVALENAYPLAGLSLSNDDGLLWENRGLASEAYFNDYSWDWEENQELLSDVRAMQRRYGSDYVALADSIVQDFVAAVYYRNPEPFIQDKGGNRDLSRMVTDVASAMHADADSEQIMKDAFYDQSWAGFGLPFVSFRQDYEEVPAEEEGEESEIIVKKQKVTVDLISPWDVRFDPRGRKWDMSDHKYLMFLFFPTLSQIMRWPWMSFEDKQRIIAWNKAGRVGDHFSSDRYSNQLIDYVTMGDEETDPDHIQIPMWQIWDRTKKLILYRPAGASFVLTPQPWPEEFEEADCFPVVYMPKNREAKNRRGTTGFIGIPDIRKIKPFLLAIRRLWSLFLAANQHAVFKYLSPKGALEPGEQAKLMTDVQREIIEFDPENLNAFPTEMREKILKEGLLALIEQPDLKETRHLVGIKQALDMIAQIMGQSSGARGGMPDTETATDSVIVDARLKARESNARHQGGKHYMKLTKLMFLVAKQRHELPIQYQMTTSYNKKVWAAFSADKLRELDLHFDYGVDSSEPKTRDQQFALYERFAALMVPMLQASGNARTALKLGRDMGDILGIRNVDQYFNDEVIELLKQLATLFHGIQAGEIDPANPQVVAKEMELISQVMSQMLTESDLADVMAQKAGAPTPEPAGIGSMPSPMSPGEQAYESGGASAGAAASGAIGGMAN